MILELKWGNPKYKCGCGSNIQIQEKARHNKTKRHITFLNTFLEC